MSAPGYPIPSGFRASPCRGLSPEAMERVQAKAESSRLCRIRAAAEAKTAIIGAAPPDPLGLLSTRALDAPWYTAEGAIRILSERVLDLEARIDSIEDHLAASATDLVQRILSAQGGLDASEEGPRDRPE